LHIELASQPEEDAVNLRLFSQRAVSFLQSHHTRYFLHPDTSQFLKERNARLIVQMNESRSFYGLRLNPETQFSVGSELFRIRVTLLGYRTLSISVSKQNSAYLLQTYVPINTSALALALNLNHACLRIEIDAEAPGDVL
jgi:hypothetical protein